MTDAMHVEQRVCLYIYIYIFSTTQIYFNIDNHSSAIRLCLKIEHVNNQKSPNSYLIFIKHVTLIFYLHVIIDMLFISVRAAIMQLHEIKCN